MSDALAELHVFVDNVRQIGALKVTRSENNLVLMLSSELLHNSGTL